MVKVKDSSPLWSASEIQMITADGNNKGSRVFCEMAPCLTITTIKSLVVKVEG